MKVIKISGISKAAKALIREIGDNQLARTIRTAERLVEVAEKRFDGTGKELKGGDAVAVNSKGQPIGYYWGAHDAGFLFKKASDFAKFVKLCEDDEEDEKPAKKEKKAAKPPKKEVKKGKVKPGKAKKKSDEDDDEEDDDTPVAKRAKPGAKSSKKPKPAPKKKSSKSEDDDDDEDNWEKDEKPARGKKGKDEKPVKKGKKAAESDDDDDADDGNEPDVDLEKHGYDEDDNTAKDNALAITSALRAELKRLKVKSENVSDLLDVLQELIESIETESDGSASGSDADGSEEELDSDND